ncbi:hypothetical protein FNAPI_9694 [Fusarium napiforme]|uniref:Uncharacterized protein n=1 Tax=Fusarium napiforme TaxID=42672 RepID=A0A8H5IW84_9HYPO|nr:hypothetical protein FNAPI_9694 [Fusarium napiforme]
MATSRSSGPAGHGSLAGAYNFIPAVRKELNKAEAELHKLQAHMVSLREGASPGEDNATEAGYDPADRNVISSLLSKGKDLLKESSTHDEDIRMAKTSMELLQRQSVAGALSGDDEAALNRASRRALKLVSGSASNIHSLFYGLGVPLTPEQDNAIRNALAPLSDSQIEQIMRGNSDDLTALQARFDAQSDELSAAKQKAQDHSSNLQTLVDERNEAIRQFDEKSKIAEEASRGYDRARQDVAALRENLTGRETSLNAANQECSRLQNEVIRLQNEVNRLISEVKARDKAISNGSGDYSKLQERCQQLGREKDQLALDLSTSRKGQSDQIRDLEGQKDAEQRAASEAKAALQAALSERDEANNQVTRLDSRLQSQSDEIEKLNRQIATEQDGATNAKASLQEARNGLNQSNDRLQDLRSQLIASRQETTKAKEDCRSKEDTISEQRQTLDSQGKTITKLEKALDEQKSTVVKRDGIIEAQIDHASVFLRRLLAGIESDCWRTVIEEVLVDSTRNPPVSNSGRLWDLFSWSPESNLQVHQDRRTSDIIALDVLAMLHAKMADIEGLLTCLKGLQLALVKSPPMISAIAQLLLKAFTDAVGDSRLHLMHKVAMRQIVELLAPTVEGLLPFTRALDGVDPRISCLVEALRAFVPDRIFSLADTMTYRDLALVGFNQDPQGILAVSLTRFEICWVDMSRVQMEFGRVRLLPNKGGQIDIPLQEQESFEWAATHVQLCGQLAIR